MEMRGERERDAEEWRRKKEKWLMKNPHERQNKIILFTVAKC